jgi:sugar phosphate isomerase/epimerase
MLPHVGFFQAIAASPQGTLSMSRSKSMSHSNNPSHASLSALNRRQLLKHAATAAGVGAALSVFPFGEARSEEKKVSKGFRYAICNESFEKNDTFEGWPFDKAFAFSAECGYQGVEIAPFTVADNVTKISAAKRTEIRQQAEKAKLDVVGLHWLLAKTTGFYVTTPDADVRRRTADYMGELARFCADLGGKIMVWGSPKQRSLLPGVNRDQAMKYAAEVLTAVVPTLEKTDVTIAIEPLGPSDTDFINTAADAVELSKMVGSPRVRLHLDCKAMLNEPTPIPELIRKFRNEFVHFHANDGNLQGPGFGTLDFVPIFQALKEVDYRGWVSVEMFDYTPGVERLVKDSLAYMKKCEAKI